MTRVSLLKPLVLSGFLAFPLLHGCAMPIMVGAAATAGYVGLQERTAQQVVLDTKIQTHIVDRLVGKNYKFFSNISVDVFESEVLITGIVPDQTTGEEILHIIQTTPDVKQIYNELFVGTEYPAATKANDAWVGTQVRTRLLGNKQAFPINYKISVVNSHVYIIGYVTTDAEHEHVLHVLRTTKGVKQVHDYLRFSPTGKDPRKIQALETAIDSDKPSALPDDSFDN